MSWLEIWLKLIFPCLLDSFYQRVSSFTFCNFSHFNWFLFLLFWFPMCTVATVRNIHTSRWATRSDIVKIRDNCRCCNQLFAIVTKSSICLKTRSSLFHSSLQPIRTFSLTSLSSLSSALSLCATARWRVTVPTCRYYCQSSIPPPSHTHLHTSPIPAIRCFIGSSFSEEISPEKCIAMINNWFRLTAQTGVEDGGAVMRNIWQVFPPQDSGYRRHATLSLDSLSSYVLLKVSGKL